MYDDYQTRSHTYNFNLSDMELWNEEEGDEADLSYTFELSFDCALTIDLEPYGDRRVERKTWEEVEDSGEMLLNDESVTYEELIELFGTENADWLIENSKECAN